MRNVGIDIVELERISLTNEKLINRYLSLEELKEFNKLSEKHLQRKYLASRWVLKEAIYKALPHEHLVFNQINITKNKWKQPVVQIKDYEIKLSLSHNNTNVIAIAVVF